VRLCLCFCVGCVGGSVCVCICVHVYGCECAGLR